MLNSSGCLCQRHFWRIHRHLFKEIDSPLEGDGCHPWEQVGHTVNVGLLEGNHEASGTEELDVLTGGGRG
jgi:hypothetical protein